MSATATETLEFKAELKQLLHLITHSLYSDRDIFLRELVSNAADAINKARFNSLADEERLEGDRDWKISLVPDKAAGTLTVRDNGVGMSRDDVVDHLGTVAKSGTKAFVQALKEKQAADAPGLIGQFGVGFYSAFMVADTVKVLTRPAGAGSPATLWESDGQGTFRVEPAEKAKRGTDVILHLKDDAKEYLEPWKLRQLVTKFSNFLEHPVALVTTEEKDGTPETTEDVLNSRAAIWLRSPREVKPEEYADFYKQVSGDFEPPAKTLHFSVEGKSEFRALLFLPAKKPFKFDFEEQKAGLKLYVQRVLIMDRCEQLLPPWLRFVEGVVDSADLPLNVSRELLQQNPHLDVIRKNVVRNVLGGLEAMKNVEEEKYLQFYKGLGSVLKEGLARDFEYREKIADLLLFESDKTPAGKFTTLAEYLAAMPEGQSEIITLSGESAAQLRNSPYLESFRAKGCDVLFLTDPVDEFAIPYLTEYKGKKLRAADRADAAAGDDVPAETKDRYANLLAALKVKLPEAADVRLTTRLTESAACLVADANAPTAHMERLLQRFSGADGAPAKRVLELNPANPAVAALRELHAAKPDDPRLDDLARLVYDQAVIAEGSKVPDPAGFARRLNVLIAAVAPAAAPGV